MKLLLIALTLIATPSYADTRPTPQAFCWETDTDEGPFAVSIWTQRGSEKLAASITREIGSEQIGVGDFSQVRLFAKRRSPVLYVYGQGTEFSLVIEYKNNRQTNFRIVYQGTLKWHDVHGHQHLVHLACNDPR